MSDINQVFRTWLGKKLSDSGIKANDDQLSVVAEELKKRYQSRMENTQTSLQTPRTSTQPQTMEGLVKANTNLIDAERQRQGMYFEKGNQELDWRGTQINQDVGRYGGMMDANTKHVMTVLGDNYANMKRDQRQFYGDMHDNNIGYYNTRDQRVFDAINREQNLQERQLTMDMILRLAGTAAQFLD